MHGFLENSKMSSFEDYHIRLKELPIGTHSFSFLLENDFFEQTDEYEITGGEVDVDVTVVASSAGFEVTMAIEGEVQIPCNRCLDTMEQYVEAEETISVRFGDTYNDEEEVITVPEMKGVLYIADFLRQIVLLAIPMKHVHRVGECNEAMAKKLRSHLAVVPEDDDDFEHDFDSLGTHENDFLEKKQTDPRWDSLKSILENN